MIRIHVNRYINNSSSRGQAVVEYVLVLVVTVTILTMLTVQIFKPFQSFLNSYMGEYVRCLLDSGELPSLGGESTLLEDSCDAKFETASWNGGRPPKGGASGETSGGSSRNGKSTNSQESEARRNTGGSGASSSVGSTSRAFRAGSKGIDGDFGERGKVIETPLEGNPTQFRNVRQNAGVGSVGGKSTLVIELSEEQKKQLGSGIKGKGDRIIATEAVGTQAKKTLLKPPNTNVDLKDEKGQEWSIGVIFRIFFIAAILIIIIALFGGQVAQMMKGWEK